MNPLNSTYAPVQALVDELVRCGLRHAVISPGSRNAPVSLTLAARPELECLSVLDERSAGFAALGLAKATGRPVVVTCTSGTAAANLLPAVAEAREARVPLVVLTADRPPELRDVGAGQAIDQIKLYGSAAKWFVEAGEHEPSRETARHFRALGCRVWHTAASGRPGAVHVNLPLREPLAPIPETMDADAWQGRPDGRPWTELTPAAAALGEQVLDALAAELAAARRGAIVCGPTGEDVAEPAAALAAALGWPLLAEPASGVRCGPHDRSAVVAHYDVLLRSDAFFARTRPDLVLRVGDTPTSKPLRTWLADTRQVLLDPHAAWHEPTRGAERIVVAAAAPSLAALAAATAPAAHPDPAWLESWRGADERVPDALARTTDPFEPKAIAALADALPDGATVWTSSSMPVRDLEAFFPQGPARIRFLANRGANGIDGVVSSAAGAAAVAGGRGWLVTGELALLHDLGGLQAARANGIELTILCLNNGGGAIFDFLPVAAHADPALYERFVATPSDLDLSRLAALFDLPHSLARTPQEVAAAAAGPGLVEVRTDRADNVRLHRRLVERVSATLDTD